MYKDNKGRGVSVLVSEVYKSKVKRNTAIFFILFKPGFSHDNNTLLRLPGDPTVCLWDLLQNRTKRTRVERDLTPGTPQVSVVRIGFSRT